MLPGLPKHTNKKKKVEVDLGFPTLNDSSCAFRPLFLKGACKFFIVDIPSCIFFFFLGTWYKAKIEHFGVPLMLLLFVYEYLFVGVNNVTALYSESVFSQYLS